MSTNVEELKQMIINLKMRIVELNVPKGHCPYAYYPSIGERADNCNDIDCTDCHIEFNRKMLEHIEKEVAKL